jgi:thioredoxin-dependent peroxiredoxin
VPRQQVRRRPAERVPPPGTAHGREHPRVRHLTGRVLHSGRAPWPWLVRPERSESRFATLSAMEKGDLAPDFELPDEDGTPRRLSDLVAKGPVVLFFYPAALTYGCTVESCHFRDMKAEFESVGANRVGISADQVEKQKQFSEKHSFDFPLLSDPDGTVATEFGVRRKFAKLTPTKRATFIIGPDLRIIEVIRSEVRMNLHADRALEVLKTAQPA